MINLDGHSLPWYLIGVLVTALLAVFYAIMKGKLLPSRIAELLRESAEKRADHLQATADVNTETIRRLVDSVEKLMVYAENQDKILRTLYDQAPRAHPRGKGDAP